MKLKNIINIIPHSKFNHETDRFVYGIYDSGTSVGSYAIDKNTYKIERFAIKDKKEDFEKQLQRLIDAAS